MFELMAKFGVLMSEGDIAKIAAALPTIQADLALIGDDMTKLGFHIKRLAAACDPIIAAAAKLKS